MFGDKNRTIAIQFNTNKNDNHIYNNHCYHMIRCKSSISLLSIGEVADRRIAILLMKNCPAQKNNKLPWTILPQLFCLAILHHRNGNSSVCPITILQYHFIAILLYYYIAILLYYYIIILLYYYIIILLYYYIIILLYYYIITLLYYYIIILLFY